MGYCANQDCPHRLRTGATAEYQSGIEVCAECQTPLTTGPIPPAKREVSNARLRLMTTGLAAGLYLAGLRLPVWEVGNTSVPAVGAGLAPIVIASVLARIVLWIVPHRRTLCSRLSLVLPLPLALGYGGWLLGQAERDSPGVASGLVALFTLTGGTYALVVLARLVDRFGLGSGMAVLVGCSAVNSSRDVARDFFVIWRSAGAAQGQILLALVVIASVVAGTLLILSVHQRVTARVAGAPHGIPLPLSGIVPLDGLALAMALPSTMATLTFPDPGLLRVPHSLLVDGALLLLFGVSLGLAAHRPHHIAALWARSTGGDAASLEPAARRQLGLALGQTMIFLLVAMMAGALLATVSGVPSRPGPYAVIVATALGADLWREWRAHKRHPDLVPAGSLHDLWAIEPALSLLARESIPAAVRGARTRALFQLLGPFVPVVILVPRVHAGAAARVIASLGRSCLDRHPDGRVRSLTHHRCCRRWPEKPGSWGSSCRL